MSRGSLVRWGARAWRAFSRRSFLPQHIGAHSRLCHEILELVLFDRQRTLDAVDRGERSSNDRERSGSRRFGTGTGRPTRCESESEGCKSNHEPPHRDEPSYVRTHESCAPSEGARERVVRRDARQ